ncbi:uncharacterized protein LOC144927721 isoform X3 [Branchiostoma floridae x Branchiostoma belcheri]
MPADLAAATVISEPVSAQKEGAGQSWTQPRTCIGPLPPTSSTAGCPSKCAHFTAAYTQVRLSPGGKDAPPQKAGLSESRKCLMRKLQLKLSWRAGCQEK